MSWPDRPGPLPGDRDPDILEAAPARWARPRSLLERVPRRLMLVTAAALLAGGGAALVVSSGGRHGPGAIRPVVHAFPAPAACAEFVNLTSPHVASGFRVVLGDVAVPPAYLPPGPPGGSRNPQFGSRWRYGWKTAFSFRGDGPPVTISVPEGWRARVALFGPPGRLASTLRIPGCPPRGLWDSYVSSFFLHSPGACVPLRIQAGRRSATVWFGLGRRC